MVQVGVNQQALSRLPTLDLEPTRFGLRDAAGAFRVVYVPSSKKRFMSLHAFLEKDPKDAPGPTSSWPGAALQVNRRQS